MIDFRQIYDNGTNGGEWSIWSNMASQMEIRIMTKNSISSSLSLKIIRTENQTCYFKNIEECGSSAVIDNLSTSQRLGIRRRFENLLRKLRRLTVLTKLVRFF